MRQLLGDSTVHLGDSQFLMPPMRHGRPRIGCIIALCMQAACRYATQPWTPVGFSLPAQAAQRRLSILPLRFLCL